MTQIALVPTALQRQRPASGVFFIQYLSVILIILTVIAASLTRRVPQRSDVEVAPLNLWTEIASSTRPLTEWTQWTPLEAPTRQCEPQGTWANLRFVLQQHDVTLQVELLSPTASLALAYAEGIREVLEVSALDAAHISLLVAPSHRGTEVRTRFVSAPHAEAEGV